ncbi:UMP-CMP kinase [Halotydeus destructor]|nr:UMP-CMP kinase [Halotydeus destructor]
MAATHPDVVFVLGQPGAGKGTQCTRIVQDYGFVHLSAGDLLREERNTPGSAYGEMIEEHIRNGTIVPVEVTCTLLENAMNKHIEQRLSQGDTAFGSGKFLVDGFPRNQNNQDGWQKQMAAKVNLKFVLFFDCPDELCVQRCLDRGAAGSGRSDDNENSLRKRFDTFLNETFPIIQLYEKQGLVRKIDASRIPDEVYADVKAIF